MKTVATFLNVEAAEIARGRLATFNIVARVLEHFDPYPGTRDVHLQVEDDDYRTALKILEETPQMIDHDSAGILGGELEESLDADGAQGSSDDQLGEDSIALEATPSASKESIPDVPPRQRSIALPDSFGRALLALLLLGALPWILLGTPVCFGYTSWFSGTIRGLRTVFVADVAWLVLVAVFFRHYNLSLAEYGIDGRKVQMVHGVVGWMVIGYLTQSIYQPLGQTLRAVYGTAGLDRSWVEWDEIPFAYNVVSRSINLLWSSALIIVSVRSTQLIGWPKWLSILLAVGLLGMSNTPAWTIYESLFTMLLSAYYLYFNCGVAVILILLFEWLYSISRMLDGA